MGVLLVNANAVEWAASYDGPPFHALLCDPPYELEFMGKDWDASGVSFDPNTWKAFAAHLYPGAFGMAFASARGWHRLAVAIEDAGLIIHPSIFGWAYGSGFPKATRIDTQVDKDAGAEREVIGEKLLWGHNAGSGAGSFSKNAYEGQTGITRSEPITAPATPLAAAWEGHRYGLQALKPALEPIIVFQKPYEGRSVDCITKTGAGALNIDEGRIKTQDGKPAYNYPKGPGGLYTKEYQASSQIACAWNSFQTKDDNQPSSGHTKGRWPSNLILQHTPECGEDCPPECPVRRMGEQSGESKSTGGAGHATMKSVAKNIYGDYSGKVLGGNAGGLGDKGTAARFFYRSDWMAERLDEADPVRYCAKAGRKERNEGLGKHQDQEVAYSEYRANFKDTKDFVTHYPDGTQRPVNKLKNPHPAVKPIALIRYLATLLLPPDLYAPRRLLVPFAGVASEMIGAFRADWEEITGIEMDLEYCEIGRARLAHWMAKPIQPALFTLDE